MSFMTWCGRYGTQLTVGTNDCIYFCHSLCVCSSSCVLNWCIPDGLPIEEEVLLVVFQLLHRCGFLQKFVCKQYLCVCACVCVCVWERERERERVRIYAIWNCYECCHQCKCCIVVCLCIADLVLVDKLSFLSKWFVIMLVTERDIVLIHGNMWMDELVTKASGVCRWLWDNDLYFMHVSKYIHIRK